VSIYLDPESSGNMALSIMSINSFLKTSGVIKPVLLSGRLVLKLEDNAVLFTVLILGINMVININRYYTILLNIRIKN
jgi:hypothetical protein